MAQPRRSAAAAVLTRATDRGELPADLDRVAAAASYPTFGAVAEALDLVLDGLLPD